MKITYETLDARIPEIRELKSNMEIAVHAVYVPKATGKRQLGFIVGKMPAHDPLPDRIIFYTNRGIDNGSHPSFIGVQDLDGLVLLEPVDRNTSRDEYLEGII